MPLMAKISYYDSFYSELFCLVSCFSVNKHHFQVWCGGYFLELGAETSWSFRFYCCCAVARKPADFPMLS